MPSYDSGPKKGDKPKRKRGQESLLETARKRFRLASDAEAAQRAREKDDLRFQVAEKEYQWDPEALKEREGRPSLCVSQIDQPLQLILNQERSAHLGVNVHPLSETANNETAEIIQGIYRHIERDSRARNARSWGFGRAVKAGRGHWRVLTEYNDKGVGIERFYQNIVIKRILHQESVYWDPAAQEPDYSDARFCFVETWIPHDDYARLWPDSKVSDYDEAEWEGMENEAPGWTRLDSDNRSCRVVEYWYKDYAKKTIAILADGSEFEGDKLDLVGLEVMKTPKGEEMVRTYDACVVRCAKLNGAEVLEDQEWNGHHIPIITVLGRELHPFDTDRRMVGIIRNSRDAQQFYNYAVSTLVERMALEPRAPWVLPEGAAEGHPEWRDAHRRMYAFLEYKPTKIDGSNVASPPPFRSPIDGAGIAVSVQALQQAKVDFQTTTSVFDPSLGRMNEERSGRAVMALQQQSDVSTSDFMLNLQVAMSYEAMVILDLIPSIYDAPGRATRILRGDDDKSEAVLLNAPFMMDASGRPVPVDLPEGAEMPGPVKHYNLREGVYGVSVSIGKSFQSRLDEGSQMMAELFGKRPELFPMYADIFLRFQKWPAADEMAKRAAKIREGMFPGVGEGEDGQAPPEQMQAQMQAAQQQMEQMGQQIQLLTHQIETDRAKQEAAILKAQMDSQTKLRIAEDENRTKLLVAQIAGGVKAELENIAAARERRKLITEQEGDRVGRHEEMSHERGMQGAEHVHERQQQQEELAHEAAMAAAHSVKVERSQDRGEEKGNEMSDEQSSGSRSGGSGGGAE